MNDTTGIYVNQDAKFAEEARRFEQGIYKSEEQRTELNLLIGKNLYSLSRYPQGYNAGDEGYTVERGLSTKALFTDYQGNVKTLHWSQAEVKPLWWYIASHRESWSDFVRNESVRYGISWRSAWNYYLSYSTWVVQLQFEIGELKGYKWMLLLDLLEYGKLCKDKQTALSLLSEAQVAKEAGTETYQSWLADLSLKYAGHLQQQKAPFSEKTTVPDFAVEVLPASNFPNLVNGGVSPNTPVAHFEVPLSNKMGNKALLSIQKTKDIVMILFAILEDLETHNPELYEKYAKLLAEFKET